jgi:hypothetical protein
MPNPDIVLIAKTIVLLAIALNNLINQNIGLSEETIARLTGINPLIAMPNQSIAPSEETIVPLTGINHSINREVGLSEAMIVPLGIGISPLIAMPNQNIAPSEETIVPWVIGIKNLLSIAIDHPNATSIKDGDPPLSHARITNLLHRTGNPNRTDRDLKPSAIYSTDGILFCQP